MAMAVMQDRCLIALLKNLRPKEKSTGKVKISALRNG
jgi:hypothetical protein